MMDYLLSWYTFYAVLFAILSGSVALWFLGLWPVIIATLQTSAGRKATLVAIGGFLLWAASIFLYQRGKQAANEALKANSARLEDERNKRDAELKNLSADDLVKRSDKWLRD
jgi:type VI protein secretion system component VasK